MFDAALTQNQRMEALSKAYVMSVSAGAGYDVGTTDFDMDSIDLSIRAKSDMRPSIDVQLKAVTTLVDDDEDYWRFSLKRKNYDDLRCAAMIPRYLILFRMPHTEVDWLNITISHLELRHCAYWLSLSGCADIDQDSKTVHVPKKNIFDIASLQSLMQSARQGRRV